MTEADRIHFFLAQVLMKEMSPQHSASSVSNNKTQTKRCPKVVWGATPFLSAGHHLSPVRGNAAAVNAGTATWEAGEAVQVQVWKLTSHDSHKSGDVHPARTDKASASVSWFPSMLKINWWNEGCCSWTSGTFGRTGTGLRAVSEQSPSNISKEPSVSEKDNVHLGVKQCGDAEGLSLASL